MCKRERERERCPICGSTHIRPFFILNNIPVANNVICKTKDEALAFPRGKLDFKICEHCIFAWNAAYNTELLIYDKNYENNQSLSKVFQEHINFVIDQIPLDNVPMEIVEVGCGQGYFLHELRARLAQSLGMAIGFDPAVRDENVSPALIAGILSRKKFPEFFAPQYFISRHVIEHIQDINFFIENICTNIPEAQHGILETPDLEWIIRNNAYYDMYYEHCSLFTKKSMGILCKKFGFAKCSIRSCFGGQYMLAVASKVNGEGVDNNIECDNVYGFMQNFDIYIARWVKNMDALKRKFKKIGLWGGASKAVSFLHHMWMKGITIDYVVDINPQKQGGFIPGCGVEIISPKTAKDNGICCFIVTNSNYLGEIQKICNSLSIDACLIPLE